MGIWKELFITISIMGKTTKILKYSRSSPQKRSAVLTQKFFEKYISQIREMGSISDDGSRADSLASGITSITFYLSNNHDPNVRQMQHGLIIDARKTLQSLRKSNDVASQSLASRLQLALFGARLEHYYELPNEQKMIAVRSISSEKKQIDRRLSSIFKELEDVNLPKKTRRDLENLRALAVIQEFIFAGWQSDLRLVDPAELFGKRLSQMAAMARKHAPPFLRSEIERQLAPFLTFQVVEQHLDRLGGAVNASSIEQLLEALPRKEDHSVDDQVTRLGIFGRALDRTFGKLELAEAATREATELLERRPDLERLNFAVLKTIVINLDKAGYVHLLSKIGLCILQHTADQIYVQSAKIDLVQLDSMQDLVAVLAIALFKQGLVREAAQLTEVFRSLPNKLRFPSSVMPLREIWSQNQADTALVSIVTGPSETLILVKVGLSHETGVIAPGIGMDAVFNALRKLSEVEALFFYSDSQEVKIQGEEIHWHQVVLSIAELTWSEVGRRISDEIQSASSGNHIRTIKIASGARWQKLMVQSCGCHIGNGWNGIQYSYRVVLTDTFQRISLSGKPSSTSGSNATKLLVLNPTEDAELVKFSQVLQELHHTKRLIGAEVTPVSLDESIRGAQQVLWFKHGRHDAVSAEGAHLELAAGVLSSSDVASWDLDAHAQIALIACQSGVGDYLFRESANEGLVQTLLWRGAGSVIATMWPISPQLGSEFLSEIHDNFDQDHTVSIRKIQAKRFGYEDLSDFAGSLALVVFER